MTCKTPFWLRACLCLVVGACDDSTKLLVYDNIGALCLLQEGSQITIRARLDPCLQGNCRRKQDSNCHAELSDGSIIVTSRIEVLEDTAPEQCPDGCSGVDQPCGVVTAPNEGELSVVYGSEQATVDVPLTDRVALFGNTR